MCIAAALHHRSGDDTCRYGYDGVSDEHDHHGKETSQGCLGSNVAVAYGSHRHYGPVDAVGDVVKLSARALPFNHIHQCTDSNDKDDYEEEEYAYLAAAHIERPQQQVPFGEEVEQFEHTEHADEAEGAQDKQVACRTEYPGDVEGQRSQQVYDTEEAEGIVPCPRCTVETQQVFGSEDDSEHILQHTQIRTNIGLPLLDALGYDNEDTQ